MAMSITTGLGALMAAMVSSKWLRHQIWDKALPQPGEGPSKEERDNGYFTMHFFAKQGEPYMRGVSDSLIQDMLVQQRCWRNRVCVWSTIEKITSVGGVLTPALL